MRIGILTSGGDCPGMNNAIRAIGKYVINSGHEVVVIYDGYQGLVEGKIKLVTKKFFSNILDQGGSIIRSSRYPQFLNQQVQLKAVDQIKKHHLDGLVIIGGNGSYAGALQLHKLGVSCIALPGTIDNDIDSTDYTIGFHTALSTIVSLVDKIRDTATSHQRCSIVEVMGRDCGDLAVYAAIATGADVVSTKQNPLTKEQIIDKIKANINKDKKTILIIVSEGIYNVHDLAKKLEKIINKPTRATIFGHVQRGGTPNAYDRILASYLGAKAAQLLINGKKGLALGIINNKLVAHSLEQISNIKKDLVLELNKIQDKIS